MAHVNIKLNITPEWVKAQAGKEPKSGITSVGGLAARLEALQAVTPPDAGRLSLAKLVELSRRQMRLSLEQFAERTDIDLSELYAVEHGEPHTLAPRSVYRLAGFLKIAPEPLAELAGLMKAKDNRISEVAMRFAARSEPMDALTAEEEEALNWFLKQIANR